MSIGIAVEIDKFAVPGPDGNPLTYLNPRLAAKQKLTEGQIKALKISHQFRHILFETARGVATSVSEVGREETLKMIGKLFEALEFEQQELWGFDRNSDFHRFFDVPGCTCPKIDNSDRLGTPYKIIQEDCPVHGKS